VYDLSQEYYNHLNEGEKYSCDKCKVVNLSANEYDNYIIMSYHYCEPCWNYVHLKRGKCSCGATYTNRNEYSTININCGCGKEVELKW
jgi:hypothetical protein